MQYIFEKTTERSEAAKASVWELEPESSNYSYDSSTCLNSILYIDFCSSALARFTGSGISHLIAYVSPSLQYLHLEARFKILVYKTSPEWR